MKKMILMIALICGSANAWALDVVVPVESKTGNKYHIQIIVPGATSSEVAQMGEIIDKVVPEIAKTYSTDWLMGNRGVIMDRLEKEFKKVNLTCDGFGVLRVRMNGKKIVDVE